MSIPATDRNVALLKHQRGDIPDPEAYFKFLCQASGIRWVPSQPSGDHVMAGTVDGAPVAITRAEWMPLDGERGMDLLSRKLKEALP